MSDMNLTLHVWRQKGPKDAGGFKTYKTVANEHMSFLEMLDVVNERLVEKGWELADAPGPRVALVRLALTEVDGAHPVGNILTSLPYASSGAIQLLAVTADVHVFVGKVSTEVQVTDSTTGVILAEAVDRRVGSHSLLNMGSTWADVEDAIGVWVDRLARGLAKDR